MMLQIVQQYSNAALSAEEYKCKSGLPYAAEPIKTEAPLPAWIRSTIRLK